MNDDKEFPILGSTIDKSQVPSIHQKRLLAFVNHFIINTVTFLNKFIANCETKFIEVETKLQKVESALIIVEAKLASISGLGDQTKPNTNEENKTESVPIDTIQSDNQTENESNDTVDRSFPVSDLKSDANEEVNVETTETPPSEIVIGVKACEDLRYKKYFKMVQFGVPSPAVKLKMEAEGFDSSILDEPNRILEDGESSNPSEES